jgi:hypothetical protein
MFGTELTTTKKKTKVKGNWKKKHKFQCYWYPCNAVAMNVE